MGEGTQNELIFKHLLQGNSITSWDAIMKFRCTRLSGRIFDIQEKFNVEIDSKWLYNPDSKKHYKSYFLKAKEDLFV